MPVRLLLAGLSRTGKTVLARALAGEVGSLHQRNPLSTS